MYTIIKTLGKGTYGSVVLAESDKYGKIAVKTSIAKNKREHDINLNEIQILETITKDGLCPWNIKIYDHRLLNKLSLEIIMEYFEGFPLSKIQLNWRGDAAADDAFGRWTVVKNELLNAIACLHNRYNIVHRDIKLENCMFDDKQFKLVDFGLACYLDDIDKKSHCQGLAGTPYYVSPEAVKASLARRRPTWDELVASDIWAAGQTLFALAYGRKMYQYPGADRTDLFRMIREYPGMHFPSGYRLGKWTPEVRRIIMMLLDSDMVKRQNNLEQLIQEAAEEK